MGWTWVDFLPLLILFDTIIYVSYIIYDDFHRLYLTIPLLAGMCITLVAFVVLLYQRMNAKLAKDISQQVTVVLIFILMVLNVVKDIFAPKHQFSVLMGVLFLFAVMLNIFLDSLVPCPRTLRLMICAAGVAVILSLVVSIQFHVVPCVGPEDNISRATNGRLSKTLVERTIFSQLLILHIQAVFVLVVDKEQKYLPFSLGKIEKSTASSAVLVPSHSSIRDRTSSTGSKAPSIRCYPSEIPLMVVGAFTLVFHTIYTFTLIHSSPAKEIVGIALAVCVLFMIVLAVALIFWNNTDWLVVKQSLQQFSVVTIVCCLAVNAALDVGVPRDRFSLPNTILFSAVVATNALQDAVIKISRTLKIVWFGGMCVGMAMVVVSYYIEPTSSNPCESDNLSAIFGSRLNRTIAKRGVFTTLLLMHVRAAVTMLGDHSNKYFLLVTGRVRKSSDVTFVTACSTDLTLAVL